MDPDREPPQIPVPYRELTPLENFGQLLQILREQKALTPTELALRAGINPQITQRIETGQAAFDDVIDALPRLSAGLGVNCRLLSTALFDFGFRQ